MRFPLTLVPRTPALSPSGGEGLLAALAIAVFATSAFAQDAQPFVRAGLQPDGPVMVGERATLVVDVFVPTWFTSAPSFPEIEVDDAMVIFEERGTNLNERVGTASFAGQRRSYLIYPMRPGALTVPAFEVTIRYAIDARPSDPTPLRVAATTLTAMVPGEARELDYFIASTALELTTALDPEPKGLRVGDALRRTITVSAKETFAMMLPPLEPVAPDGLAAYPDPPIVSDAGGVRGDVRVGTRIESVSYVLEKEGRYELPAVEVVWWDVEARALRRARADEVVFDVAPNPDLVEEIPLTEVKTAAQPAEPPPTDWKGLARRWMPLTLIVGIALWMATAGRRRMARVIAWVRDRQRVRANFEQAYFARFEDACGSNDPGECYRSLLAWLDRAQHGAATLGAFAAKVGDPELAAELDRLSDRLFAPGEDDSAWLARELKRLVSRGRDAVRSPSRRLAETSLPALNPRSTPGRQGDRGSLRAPR